MAIRNARTQYSWVDHLTDDTIRGLRAWTGLFWVLCTDPVPAGRIDVVKFGHPWRGGGELDGSWIVKLNGSGGELIQYVSTAGQIANGSWQIVAFVADGITAGRGWIFQGTLSAPMAEVSYQETIGETMAALESQAGHDLRVGNSNDGSTGMPRGWPGDIVAGWVWDRAIPDAAALDRQAREPWAAVLYPDDLIIFSHYGLPGSLEAPDWKPSGTRRPGTFTTAGGYPLASPHPPLALREPFYATLGHPPGLFSSSGWNPARWTTEASP